MGAKKIEVKERLPLKAARFKKLRDEQAKLTKELAILREQLIEQYGIGGHSGFSIIQSEQQRLNADLVEAKLGDLTEYKTTSVVTKIEFHKK